MISERQLQDVLNQINGQFEQQKQLLDTQGEIIQRLQEALDDLKPKIGRPKKAA